MAKNKNKKEEIEEKESDEEVIETSEEATEETKEDTGEDVLGKLKSKIEEQQNSFVRLAAEYDNFRKRTAKEKDTTYNNAVAQTIETILPVIDSIELAIQSQGGAGDDYKKGLEMIKSQLYSAFDKLGVEPIGKEGEEFDPNFHNAVMHEENDKIAENTITAVLQKGYILGDRVIRPAMVKVAN